LEQKQVRDQTDLPKALPRETNDPDRLVRPDESKKPDDQDPKIESVQATPSNASITAQETAVPTIKDIHDVRRSATPSPGTGTSSVREQVTWRKELAAHFDKFKRYPSDRGSESAEVVVSFALDRTGHILSSSIVKGSGDASFDEAALAMLKRSDPVPAPPARIVDAGLKFTLPVIFHSKH
jgi:periplasmic protein TonB